MITSSSITHFRQNKNIKSRWRSRKISLFLGKLPVIPFLIIQEAREQTCLRVDGHLWQWFCWFCVWRCCSMLRLDEFHFFPLSRCVLCRLFGFIFSYSCANMPAAETAVSRNGGGDWQPCLVTAQCNFLS